jgi:hypothetical protein
MMDTTFNATDIIGFTGVFVLLVAFLLNLSGKLRQDNIVYILMNLVGAGLACVASLLINYLPFVILEGTWTLVSLVALVNYFRKKRAASDHQLPS